MFLIIQDFGSELQNVYEQIYQLKHFIAGT